MKGLSLLGVVLALGLTLAVSDAQAAKRLGSGMSSGMQRQMTVAPKAPTAAAAQAPTASAAAKSPAAAAAPAAQPKRSWMGPIAGLAAGLGLAALASHLGFGEEFASMMMIGLLVVATIAVLGFIARRRAAALQPAMAGVGGMRPGDADQARAESFRWADEPVVARGAQAAVGAHGSIPADFDVAGFVRQAKVNFIRLQAANDQGNVDDLREFTTPEMFAELKTTILARSGAGQRTDVLEIGAEVVEVVEEPSRYVVSVRYTGLIRDDGDAAPDAIDEVWHLVKPRTGTGGWLLAGIQQLQPVPPEA